ncbi:hypothetical protein IDH44_02230 [Paenibacillus sp. IB182496]|uniref:Uncharacterized protein n=1 Tax=Paenibacillus sabuli TaxID=2772509 RepID=A0A927BQC0_9BACL|nr:hypothetical protein [Paenibacillus sabuli]MBD2843996.1 hypothetical protein [Paenibacillus sabuli]
MSKMRKRMVVSLALTTTLLVSAPLTALAAKLPGAAYDTVQLEAVQTKEVTYYKAGSASIPDKIGWVREVQDLAFLPVATTSDVTAALQDEDGVYWIGTETGLQRVDFTAPDTRDIVQYFAGPRYLYGGDDHVTGLAADGAGGIWVETASGVTHIAMPEMTLQEKTGKYERIVEDVHDRFGMVSSSDFTFTETDPGKDFIDYNSETGVFSSVPSTSDNDGLWTAMYAMGEIFRYRSLQEQYGAEPTASQQAEMDEARAAAMRATKAVLVLDYVSGRGNGFPARSYMLTSEDNAATVGDSVYGFQGKNGFWFQHVVGEEAVNPNGIIPSLQRDDAEPIGYSIVRVTKDAEKKTGSRLFPSGGTDVMNYNGLGLSQAAIDALNATRPDGQKLGTDIRTIVDTVDGEPVYQVMPVITAATNNAEAAEDKTTGPDNKPLFQLTAPVYEQIPTFFNDLFPAYALVDGHVDMNQIVYKADTSSDEVIGHYALFYTAYEYLVGDAEDEELQELKFYIEEAAHRMTELILKDDHYYIEDATGKSTQWSRWLAKYFNDSLGVMQEQDEWAAGVGVDENGDDALSYGYEDGPLNALEVMAALKTAIHVTAERYPDTVQKYKDAYDLAFADSYSTEEPFVNGKGYIEMAGEYIERRLVRQATNAYSDHDNTIVTRDTIEEYGSNANATIHNDWTQYINYSDEELGWFPVYILIMLEEDEGRHQQIVDVYDQWYTNEVREENPFYTFLYQLAHPERTDVDLASAVRYLNRYSEYMITFQAQYNRQDVLYIEPGDRDDENKQTNYALAPDERRIHKHNSNPFEADDQTSGANPDYNYNKGDMEAGTVFLLPYWLGRYFEIIAE